MGNANNLKINISSKKHSYFYGLFFSFRSYPRLGNAFISLEISLQFYIFFSLISFIQAFSFISLQIKEFRIMGLSINDSVYSSVFFFLTGLHFFHLLFGLLLLSLLFWSCSFPVHYFSFHSWNFLSSIGSGITFLS